MERHFPFVRHRFLVSESFETCLIYDPEIFYSAYVKNRRTKEYFASWKNGVLYDPLKSFGTKNMRVWNTVETRQKTVNTSYDLAVC